MQKIAFKGVPVLNIFQHLVLNGEKIRFFKMNIEVSEFCDVGN